MRHTITRALVRIYGVIAGTYVQGVMHIQKVLQLPKWATATADDIYVHQIQSCICGYHVYQRIWYPTLGKILGTARERDNTHDRYAVAVLEAGMCCVVGHLPRVISRECYFFLRSGGTITAEVTGRRRKKLVYNYLSVFRARHGYDRLWIL